MTSVGPVLSTLSDMETSDVVLLWFVQLTWEKVVVEGQHRLLCSELFVLFSVDFVGPA